MEQKSQEMSWAAICVLWFAAIPAVLLTVWIFSRNKTARQERQQRSAVAEPAQDPIGLAAFQAGYEFGARCKATGLAKLTERELDEYALQVLQEVEVPDEKRGLFITKFKRGFGWGGW